MSLQLKRVVVESFTGAGKRGAHLLEALLEPAAAALQHAHPHFSLRLPEEGETSGEVLVLPGVRSGVRQELLEVLLTFCRQAVDDLGPAPRE